MGYKPAARPPRWGSWELTVPLIPARHPSSWIKPPVPPLDPPAMIIYQI